MIPSDLVTQIQIVAMGEKVPWQLACAIVERESAGDQWAIRYESRWSYFVDPQTYATKNRVSYSTERTLQQFSYGLMQVMGSVARELGFQGPLIQLCAEPDLGIQYGCKKIHSLLEKYQDDQKAISAYNQGVPFKDDNGNYINAHYVNTVNAFRKQYGA